MRRGIFSDTATVYRREGDGYARQVLEGVQWRQRTGRQNSGGRVSRTAAVSVTIPGECRAAVKPGDIMVLGVGPEIAGEYTVARLRAEYESYCTVKTVADNTRRGKLRHWKATAA